ncbi:MAG: PAS domain S-box protein [archaeon]
MTVAGGAISALVVTADQEFAAACERHLPQMGDITVATAITAGEAIDVLVSEDTPDCIISDHDLPETDGVAFLESVRTQEPRLPFILFTSEGSEELASRAISADVTEYLIKEAHSDQWDRLTSLITDAVTYYRKHGDIVDTEHRTKTLLDAAHDTIAVVRDGHVEYINRTGVDLVGAETRSAVIGQPIEAVLSTTDDDSLDAQLGAIQRRERSLDHVQRRIELSSGDELPVEITATAAEWGNAPAAVLVVRDISERTGRERDLRLKNRAMDHAPIGITITDARMPDKPLIYVNEEFERQTGYSADEVVGRNSRFLHGDGTHPEPVTQMRDAVDADESATVELRNYRKDDTEFWSRVTIAPVRNNSDEVTHYVGFHEDITEEKERQRELEGTNELLSTLFETLPVGVLAEDASRNVLAINERLFELFEFPGAPADVIGTDCERMAERVSDLFVDADGFVERINELVATRDPVDTEELSLIDGRTFERSYRPIELPEGDGNLWVYRDITERKEDERVLRRFREAVEAAGHAIYITDPDGTITYVNSAFERITGYDSEDAVGRNPRILKSGEMSAEYYDRLWETLLDGDVWEEELLNRRQSGELYHARQTIAPVTDENGDIEAFVAIQTDISEQKERERQLRQYAHAIESTNDLVAAIGGDYQFLFANHAYRDLYGLDEGEVTDKTVPEVVTAETWETIEPYIDRNLDGESVQFEMTRSWPDQPDRTFDIRYYPLERVDGESIGAMAVMRDVTEQRERKQHLESLDRMLRHNFRNELNIVMGRAELIVERASGDVAEWGTLIQRVSEDLIGKVDKEREIVEFLSEPPEETVLDLGETINAVVDRMETTHPAAKITVDAPETLSIRTIPELGRAVEELVENAIVHTDQASPELLIRVVEREETIEIRVVDSGPAIPESERRVITEDAEIEPLVHSTGMGLWLVKRIATRADGTVRFEETDSGRNVVVLAIPRELSGDGSPH